MRTHAIRQPYYGQTGDPLYDEWVDIIIDARSVRPRPRTSFAPISPAARTAQLTLVTAA